MRPATSGHLVAALRECLAGDAPLWRLLLGVLLDSEGWRLIRTPDGIWVEHDLLREWVEDEAFGLGLAWEDLVARCAGHPELLQHLHDAPVQDAVAPSSDLSGPADTLGR